MHINLLSGGSGKRLWPLSNEVRSKQFIKIFKTEEGSYESMVQRVYRQLLNIADAEKITIATAESQVSALYNQLGSNVNICTEPCRRDTFPAIALATAYLADEKMVSKDEIVVVCPVDPYVEPDYFDAIKELARLAQSKEVNLSLLGMEPTYPSEKYGYIIPKDSRKVSRVLEFKEKPDMQTAEEYIAKGALWNGGVFAFRLGWMLQKVQELIGFYDYKTLYKNYAKLQKISVDYAVVEKEPDIQVLRFSGAWKDLGTWNTFAEAMEDASIGNVIMDDACENTHIINELDVPLLGMGLKNLVVSASPDGIIVSDKFRSSFIKPYVDTIHNRIRYAEKSWGTYQVLDVGENSLTIKVSLKPGEKMNYHYHERRDEQWTVIKGAGRVLLNGEWKTVKTGDVISLPKGCRHTVIADTVLEMIEVQIGQDIRVEDKVIVKET